MPQTNFLILGNFYQENVGEDSNLLATFDIEYSTLMWSINKLVYINETGQPFLFKIWSRHWNNSARITWNKWLVVFYSSKLNFTRQLQISCSCPVSIYFYRFCCLLDGRYSKLTNHYGWALFWWKQLIENGFLKLFLRFCQIYWTPCYSFAIRFRKYSISACIALPDSI